MCISFGYNPQIIFVTFFTSWTWSFFRHYYIQSDNRFYSGYLVCVTTSTILCRFFWNLTGAFVMVWKYACGFYTIFRFIFITFSRMWSYSMLSMLPCECKYTCSFIHRGYLLFWGEYQIYFIECGEKNQYFSRVRSTSENADIFTARDEIYLVFVEKK